jgi:hypothetical protein
MARGDDLMASMRRWAILVLAIGVLNAALTFYALWPTPFVRWQGEVSIELAAALAALAFWPRRSGGTSRPAVPMLAALWVAMAIGRYVHVLALSLFGRPINLYWDAQHFWTVAAMMTAAKPVLLPVAIVAAVVLAVSAMYRIARWAFAQLDSAAGSPGARRVLSGLAAAVAVLFGLQTAGALGEDRHPVSEPVTVVYARQGTIFVQQMLSRAGGGTLPRPSLDADVSVLSGADVLLVFMESYGAVTFDRPAFAPTLAQSRARFEADSRATGRSVVSAFVTSPTFGGSSWLAHISLMSGVEARDEETNAVLMSQRDRDTIVSTFRRAGYHTIAVMPGLTSEWPEGAFYRFNRIYGELSLQYQGPKFGWWAIPDQYVLGAIDRVDTRPSPDQPRFVFFPTTSTHAPFGPTAPYQPDWDRLLSKKPYDQSDVERAYEREPEWFDLGPSYVNAVDYGLTSLGGYLRQQAGRDLVIVLIGDHQPAAAVTGEAASWDVPVHIVTDRHEILQRLVASGFTPGMNPRRQPIGPMHSLTRILLHAFSSTEMGSPAPESPHGRYRASGSGRN